MLERLDPTPEYWNGKCGACVGLFKQIVENHEPKAYIQDILSMLKNSTNPQAEGPMLVIRQWAKRNRVVF